MTESLDKCTRCRLPVVGAVFQIHVECAEIPPKQPELRLCQPCMESMNRWLHQRQMAMRATSETPPPVRPLEPTDEPHEHSRRRYAERLERVEAEVHRGEVLKIFRMLFFVGMGVLVLIILGTFIASMIRDRSVG